MIFTQPSFVPALPSPLPLGETIGDFCMSERLAKVGNDAVEEQPIPFIDAAIDKSWTTDEINTRVAQLTRALATEWNIAPGEKWHKQVAVLASNCVSIFMDTLILTWAIHRLGGGCLMLQPTSSVEEMAAHIDHVPPFAMFVTLDLVTLGQETIQKSSQSADLPFYKFSKVYGPPAKNAPDTSNVKSLDALLEKSKDQAPIEKLLLAEGEGSKRVAYYCTTSGTGGFQRIVAITHENIIASILQAGLFTGITKEKSEIALVFTPFNHIYGLLTAHTLMWLGHSTVIHRGFNMLEVLMSIPKRRITTLYLVPPIINAMSRNASLLDRFDLSSVSSVIAGGGPLNKEDYAKMQTVRPNWKLLSGWGQTESCAVGSLAYPKDTVAGSSGVVLPGVRLRMRNDDGNLVQGLEEMGEIEMSSPSVLYEYIDNATEALITPHTEEYWRPTGDVGLIRECPSGIQHLFIVDRIRDMIKVKGHQVAPGEIEVHLMKHDAVGETAVVGIADAVAGERPLAFVIREPSYSPETSDAELRKILQDHNDSALPEIYRLQNRIIIVESIPKSANGKILKRELRKQVVGWTPPKE
uniref:AMP-dependent ligase vlmC n=1 Tax=Lecanicillium sp. TaxID=1756136 RepID=VLMC_LECSP|nr:RecName: Full=AMP-dependent ligase vlmC; AltName: Full=Verlamelin biosynthesis protein C [Lecanicillium sp.]BAO73255.1 AMP dependent ligase/synthetase [Lecanicillium sp. HF627]